MPQQTTQNSEQSHTAAEILNAFRRAIVPLGLTMLGEPELVTEFGRARNELDTLRLTLTNRSAKPGTGPRTQSEVVLSWSGTSDVIEAEAYARVSVPGAPTDADALAAQAFAMARDRGLEVDNCRIGAEYSEGRPDPTWHSVALTHEYTFSWHRGAPLAEENADIEHLCARLSSAMDGLASITTTCT